jgi:hypothetical protein
MRALCGRRLPWSGLLPGLMRLAGAASVIRLRYGKAGQPGSKMARAGITSGS